MSSTADVMSKTLDFLETKHGGVEHYLRSGGMHDDEIARIRGAIMVPSGADSDGGASTGAEEASLSSGEGALANGNALHVIEEEGEAE